MGYFNQNNIHEQFQVVQQRDDRNGIDQYCGFVARIIIQMNLMTLLSNLNNKR